MYHWTITVVVEHPEARRSVAGAWQMYIAISCLSWSTYNWSRQTTHKGQGEMWSSLYKDTCSCRRPGPKTCFLFCDRSQDLVFPKQSKWKHEAEHSWVKKDRKKQPGLFGTNNFFTTFDNILFYSVFFLCTRIWNSRSHLKYVYLKTKSPPKSFVLGYLEATLLFCVKLLTDCVLVTNVFSKYY